MSNTVIRTVACANEHCGGTVYEATYEFSADILNPKPIWRCKNCNRETPRLTRHRKSNSRKRWDIITLIRSEWTETDAALRLLVDSGTPSGCLLVHSSTFNWHLGQLMEKTKVSTRDLHYHASHARQDLEKAKQFVQSKQEVKS